MTARDTGAIPLDAAATDADNPWPGLAFFREADRGVFHGREGEIAALERLVQRERLTVLFGLSGLGKTSLLQAGLFPRLRRSGCFPVYLRLDHTGAHPPYRDQVLAEIAREAAACGVATLSLAATATLWEVFHRREGRFTGGDGEALVPLLVFDQFEEAFTLGRRHAAALRETDAFLAELADLVEGRPSPEVLARLEANAEEARGVVFARHDYKVLLSLREDFLADLEGLRPRMRSLGQNRMRLRRLNGESALEVVQRPGGRLIDAAVAEQVVRFVAGVDGAAGDGLLRDLEVEPALLSVVCRELNNKRRQLGEERITAGLLAGSREAILSEFYERSVADVGPDVRSFVEENLLTQKGYRDSIALDDALEVPGVTREALDRLVGRRLLRIEDWGGVQRLELTHDLLTGVIRGSRDSRRQRLAQEAAERAQQEAEGRQRDALRQLRRSRALAALLVLLLAASGVALWDAKRQKKIAGHALAAADFKEAEGLVEKDRRPEALAYLADAVRWDAENERYRTYLLSLLLHWVWPLPSQEVVAPGGAAVLDASFSPDGARFATASRDGTAQLWDAATHRPIGRPLRHSDRAWVVDVTFNHDGRVLATTALDKAVRLWNAQDGAPVGAPLRHSGWIVEVSFSPDGRLLLTASSDHTAQLWDASTGNPVGATMRHDDEVSSAEFSHDGSLIVTSSPDRTARLWKGRTGAPVGAPLRCDEPLTAALFSPGDDVVVTIERTGTLRFWNGQTGEISQQRIQTGLLVKDVQSSDDGRYVLILPYSGSPHLIDLTRQEGSGLNHLSPVDMAVFSRDDTRLLTATADRQVHIWSLEAWPPQETGEVLRQSQTISSAALSPDRQRALTTSLDGATRLWDLRANRGFGAPLEYETHLDRPVQLAQADGLALTHNRSGEMRVWAAPSATPLSPPILSPAPLRVVNLSRDGRVVIAIDRDGLARSWEVQSGRPLGPPIRPEGTALKIRFSQDGRRVVTCSNNGAVQVWDSRTGRKLGRYDDPTKAATDAELDPSGNRVLSFSDDGTARLWDARTGQSLGPRLQHEHPVAKALFSPDGRRIATLTVGSADLWEASTLRRIGPPLKHEKPGMLGVRFSPNGEILATTAVGAEVRLWRAKTGQPLGEVLAHSTDVLYLAFSPDSRKLATLGTDGTVYLWEVATGKTVGLPLRLGQLGAGIGFSAKDDQLLVSLRDNTVRFWDLPAADAENPEDLIDLAEATGGYQVKDGVARPVSDPFARLAALRSRYSRAPLGQPTTASFLRWFLSDPMQRTVTPFSKMTATEYARRQQAERPK